MSEPFCSHAALDVQRPAFALKRLPDQPHRLTPSSTTLSACQSCIRSSATPALLSRTPLTGPGLPDAACALGVSLALRWLAPAWAIGGLLHGSLASGKGLLAMLGHAAVSAALYLYIVALCAPAVLLLWPRALLLRPGPGGTCGLAQRARCELVRGRTAPSVALCRPGLCGLCMECLWKSAGVQDCCISGTTQGLTWQACAADGPTCQSPS